MRKRTRIIFCLAVALVCVGAWLAYSWKYDYPQKTWLSSDGYQETGTLLVLENPDWPIDRAERIRDLSVRETQAFRHFIRTSVYVEYDNLQADHGMIPIVKIDGVYLWVYRSSMYRFHGGTWRRRMIVDGLQLSKESPPQEIQFNELLEWYESEKD
ncbi:MAG: hypothetical protein ACYTDT_04095 [Planctomycetota bacterium]|jgi:hypothetical protein